MSRPLLLLLLLLPPRGGGAQPLPAPVDAVAPVTLSLAGAAFATQYVDVNALVGDPRVDAGGGTLSVQVVNPSLANFSVQLLDFYFQPLAAASLTTLWQFNYSCAAGCVTPVLLALFLPYITSAPPTVTVRLLTTDARYALYRASPPLAPNAERAFLEFYAADGNYYWIVALASAAATVTTAGAVWCLLALKQ